MGGMKPMQFSLQDLFAATFWIAIGIISVIGFQTVLPNRPSLDLLAKLLDIACPLTAGAAFGAAIGVFVKKQFAFALAGIGAGFLFFFVLG